MKNVRLFAVAAAMGMFATTVAAAEPTTKEAYIGTWGEMTEIVKVDIGNAVVAPTATIKVVKETRTDNIADVTTSDKLGFQLYPTCYKGYTNEIGKDNNLDGWVDAPMLFANTGWVTNDAKFFPSAKTAMYYIGATDGSSILGGYFLAPGAEEKEIYASDIAHKQFADAEAVVNWLIEEGQVSWNYDEDEEIVSATINTVVSTDAKGNHVTDFELRLVPNFTKKVEDKLIEAIADIYVKGATAEVLAEHDVTLKPFATSYNDSTQSALTYLYDLDGDDIPELELDANTYYIVTENRKKDTYSLEVATASDLIGGKAYDASGKEIELDANYITFIMENDDSDDDVTIGGVTGASYSRFSTVKIAKNTKYSEKYVMVWSEELAGFVSVNVGAQEVAADTTIDGYYWGDPYYASAQNVANMTDEVMDIMDIVSNAYGLLELNTVENDSDKIVVVHPALAGLNAQLSVKDETFTYEIYYEVNNGLGTSYTDVKTLTVGAVRLEDGWYPAVNDEEELVAFISEVAGLGMKAGRYEDLNGDGDYADTVSGVVEKSGAFGTWMESNYLPSITNPIYGFSAGKARTLPDGTKEVAYMPENARQHYNGTFCTYSVEGTEEVVPTITNDAATIDTTTAGVKTLTYTAKVGEEVVGTKEISVVVAPNYERVYKNGRVVKLTAKWLNGNTYAVYNYDWTAKTFTATFYEEDGVTVSSSTNGSL